MSKIKCDLCDDVIESKHRHDFKTCKCGACSVDGGDAYLRLLGDITKLQVWDEEKKDWGYIKRTT